ncbi:MAG: DUF4037 domain-containing protein [Defluviitaleaceae bacterium]|nr:DUF4037 domain-containing protein [Defluviitaleaceae bacterium]
MDKPFKDSFASLIRSLAEFPEVTAAGKTGGPGMPDDGGDIDIFIFCSHIPALRERQEIARGLGPAANAVMFSETGGRWGTIDIFSLDTTEFCLMYFTEDEMSADIDSVLDGSRLDKEADGFYPTGRCATMLSLYAFFDKYGYIAGMKERLSVYPPDLAEKMVKRHLRKANDAESFERAVSRADALFYHETAENAIGHFLQALFALNGQFFPSRKRTAQYIEEFGIKPRDCVKRLLEMIELGAGPETLAESHGVWIELYTELCDLAGQHV